MVAVIEPRLTALHEALGAVAEQVNFVDMAILGKNPARIIPAWYDFVQSSSGPLRGVGEPIWAGRRRSEIEESQFHEALLNLAVTPDTPLWLLCPYDADALPDDVVDEAHRSHPAFIDADVYRGSTVYGGAYHVGAMFGRELSAPVGPVRNLVVSGNDGPQVADWVRRWAEGSGLSVAKARRLASAMRDITQDTVHRPGRSEVLQLWQEGSALICQIHDAAHVQDPLIGRRPDGQENAARDGAPSGERSLRPGSGALGCCRNHRPRAHLALNRSPADASRAVVGAVGIGCRRRRRGPDRLPPSPR